MDFTVAAQIASKEKKSKFPARIGNSMSSSLLIKAAPITLIRYSRKFRGMKKFCQTKFV